MTSLPRRLGADSGVSYCAIEVARASIVAAVAGPRQGRCQPLTRPSALANHAKPVTDAWALHRRRSARLSFVLVIMVPPLSQRHTPALSAIPADPAAARLRECPQLQDLLRRKRVRIALLQRFPEQVLEVRKPARRVNRLAYC